MEDGAKVVTVDQVEERRAVAAGRLAVMEAETAAVARLERVEIRVVLANSEHVFRVVPPESRTGFEVAHNLELAVGEAMAVMGLRRTVALELRVTPEVIRAAGERQAERERRWAKRAPGEQVG
jgi:hypothetical protein